MARVQVFLFYTTVCLILMEAMDSLAVEYPNRNTTIHAIGGHSHGGRAPNLYIPYPNPVMGKNNRNTSIDAIGGSHSHHRGRQPVNRNSRIDDIDHFYVRRPPKYIPYAVVERNRPQCPRGVKCGNLPRQRNPYHRGCSPSARCRGGPPTPPFSWSFIEQGKQQNNTYDHMNIPSQERILFQAII
ncbi:hypothetical protein Dimus_032776 [Dionaea muscipula]